MIRILIIFLTLNLSTFASSSGGKWPLARFNQATGLAPKSFNYDESDRVTDVLIDGQVQQSFIYANGQLASEETGTGDWADNKTYEYDQRGRLKTATSVLDGNSSFEYFLDENETETDMKGGDRLKIYTDPNGVVYHYEYDDRGNTKTISIENGPTFHYVYDDSGNLLDVSVDDMRVTYENYNNGLPSNFTWTSNGQNTVFTVEQDEVGRLSSVTDGSLALELDWSGAPSDATCESADSPPPLITEVVRRGPGFQEIWSPDYDENQRLRGTTISRRRGSDVTNNACPDCEDQVIEETYGVITNQIAGGLRRVVDGVTVIDLTHTLDDTADNRRVLLQDDAALQTAMAYDNLGSLESLTQPNGDRSLFEYDGERRVREITAERGAAGETTQYKYDLRKRRVTSEGVPGNGDLVYAYHGSQVIAIGMRDGAGKIQWTHAFGRGPLGVAFMKDLTHTGHDAFIFTDHLGTPFAYKQPQTNVITYTPFNPWGELLASHPYPQPQYANQGAAPTWGFQLPTDPVFSFPPLGLSGHVYDHHTGLVYMHHRYYHPRLGHFLTPDFRAPDIYDPSTFTEPYAYAAGNPVMFWDPDGLDPSSKPFHLTVADFGGDEDKYVEALIQWLSQKEFLVKPNRPYPGYRNFDQISLMFTQITTPRELEYQIAILRYVLRGDHSAETKQAYGHFLSELLGIQDEYMGADRGFYSQPAISWKNRRETTTSGWSSTYTGAINPPTEWKASIHNSSGQARMAVTYFAANSLITAGASRGPKGRTKAKTRINLNPATNPRAQTIPRGTGRAPSMARPPLLLPSPRTATQIRNTSGSATGGFELPHISGQWLRGSNGNAGLMPKQIADQLRGRSFRDFGEFRNEFWKAVANDPALAQNFRSSNITRMRKGLAPLVPKEQRLGGQVSYTLHHATPIQRGGGVYDLDNLLIVTPRFHKEILDPTIHY